MAFHMAATPTPWPLSANPAITTRSFCVCGDSGLMFLIGIGGVIVGTGLGAIVGWLAVPLVGMLADKVMDLIPGAANLIPGWWGDFIDWMKDNIPVPAAWKGPAVGALLGAALSVGAIEAAECPACPPGRRCYCFCVSLFFGIIPLLAYPCGGTCGATAPGCT